MATRGRQAADVDEDGEDWRVPAGAITTAPAPTPEEDAESMIERLRAMLTTTANADGLKRVSLFRIDPRSPNMIWCANYTPEEFAEGDMTMIREQWGPGLYEARVIGSKGIATKGRFQIAAALANPATAIAPRDDGAMSALTAIMSRMADQQSQILQALATRPDPQAEVLRQLEMLRAMRDTFAPAAVAVAPAPAPDPVAQITTLLAAVRALKDASGEFQPEKPDDGPGALIGLAGNVIEMVKGSMSQNAPLQPMAVPPSLAMPVDRRRIAQAAPIEASEGQTAPENPAISSPVAQPESVPETMEILILRGTLQGLVELAKNGADAEKGGAYIFEKLPDDLVPYLELPNALEILNAFASNLGVDLSPYAEWLKDARVVALRLLAEDDALPD